MIKPFAPLMSPLKVPVVDMSVPVVTDWSDVEPIEMVKPFVPLMSPLKDPVVDVSAPVVVPWRDVAPAEMVSPFAPPIRPVKVPVVEVSPAVVVVPRLVGPAVEVIPLLKVTSPDANDMVNRTACEEMELPAAIPDDDNTSHEVDDFLINTLPFELDEMWLPVVGFQYMSQ